VSEDPQCNIKMSPAQRFRVQSLGIRVWGLGCRVGIRV